MLFKNKTTLKDRLKGISFLENEIKDQSVFDAGCAEGLVSQYFLDHGASVVHGLDYSFIRISEAQKLNRYYNNCIFKFSDFSKGKNLNQEWMLTKYDIVLLMNVFEEYDIDNILPILHKTKKYFCYRGFIREEVSKLCESEGFKLVNKDYTLTFKAN